MSFIQEIQSVLLIGIPVLLMCMTIFAKSEDQNAALWFESFILVIFTILFGFYYYELGWKWAFIAFEIHTFSFTVCWTMNVVFRRIPWTKPIIFGSLLWIILSSIDFFIGGVIW